MARAALHRTTSTWGDSATATQNKAIRAGAAAPSSEGVSADVAGDEQWQREVPQHVAYMSSIPEGQSSAELVLTSTASPLCSATKTNSKLVQANQHTGIAHISLTAWYLKVN